MIEYLPLVLTGLGLTASITYYALILRNQTNTLKTQIFMQIYNQFNSEDTSISWAELVNQERLDYEDFKQKYDSSVNPAHYGKRSHLWYTFNAIGELLRMEIMDVELLHRLSLGPLVIVMWEKWEYIIRSIREREKGPELWEGFEYLYNKMKDYRKKRGCPDFEYPI